MKRLSSTVTRITEGSVRWGPSPMGSPVKRRMSCSSTMTNAGPVMNADAMKRGASSAEFQKGRPPRPL